jgi:hypothetical protein
VSRPVPLQPSMEGARYVELVGRLNAFNGQGALLINLLMLASIWGKWRQFGIVFGIALLASIFNIWINLVYLKKHGPRAELLRCSVNAIVTLATGYVTGWTLPCWFWLPFFALVLDHLQGKIAVVSLAGLCVFTDLGALLDGVHWMYPLGFSLLAVGAGEGHHLLHPPAAAGRLRGSCRANSAPCGSTRCATCEPSGASTGPRVSLAPRAMARRVASSRSPMLM